MGPQIIYEGDDLAEAREWADANRPAQVRHSGPGQLEVWSWANHVQNPNPPEWKPWPRADWPLTILLVALVAFVGLWGVWIGEPGALILALVVGGLVIAGEVSR